MATGNNEDFLLHSRTEILALLRGIKNSHSLVTAHFDQGRESMVTAILDVLEDRNILILDYGVDERLNRRLLQNEKVIFVTSHDKVKVQFSTGSLKRVRYDKLDAFKAVIPDAVLRMQRREFYRIDTPVVHPLHCLVPRLHGQGPVVAPLNGDYLDAQIVNLSAGGVCIVDFPSESNVALGTVFKGCNISLPGIGTFEVDMEVVNIYEVQARNSSKAMRYGCRFIDLSGNTQSMIQRFILQLERERRASLL